MIIEGRRLGPDDLTVDPPRRRYVSPIGGRHRRRESAGEAVRLVGRDAFVDGGLVHPVAQHVVDRAVRPVDRQLGEVRPAEPGQLGVQVGEQPGLHQRIVGDLDARHQMSGVEGDLLGLGEVVGRVAIQGQLADQCTGASSSGTSLVGSSRSMPSNVSVPSSGITWRPSSYYEERAGVDAVGEIAAVEVRVAPGRDLRLLPHQRVHAGHRLPVELHQTGLAVGVDHPEGVDAEALHRPVGTRDAAVATSSTSRGGSPRCAARRSPRTCRAPTAPAGSPGPGAAWRRG